jgi:hypothetical protein
MRKQMSKSTYELVPQLNVSGKNSSKKLQTYSSEVNLLESMAQGTDRSRARRKSQHIQNYGSIDDKEETSAFSIKYELTEADGDSCQNPATDRF